MRTLEAAELKGMLDREEDLLLLYVLDPGMFEREHIPGSHNVPTTDLGFLSKVERLAGRKDRRIVVYCSSPACHASLDAGAKLERAGFSDLLHYPGGIAGWKAAGHAMEQDATDSVT